MELHETHLTQSTASNYVYWLKKYIDLQNKYESLKKKTIDLSVELKITLSYHIYKGAAITRRQPVLNFGDDLHFEWLQKVNCKLGDLESIIDMCRVYDSNIGLLNKRYAELEVEKMQRMVKDII